MTPLPTTFTIYTDASNLAWGVTLVTQESMGFFDSEERELHITWKELSAVTKARQAQAPSLRGQHILLMTSNQVVQSVVNKGTSKSPQLMLEYREIFKLLFQFDV